MRPVPFAAVVLAALALGPGEAGGIATDYLDGFADAVDERIALLPTEGLTKTQAKERKALLKADAALGGTSGDAVGDLALAKKAAKAVEKTLAADAALLGALDDALDGFEADAEALLDECLGLLDGVEDDRSHARFAKAAGKAQASLDAAGEAATRSARAAALGKAMKGLVALAEDLEEYDEGPGPGPGECPVPDPLTGEGIGVGTFSAVVGGTPWTSDWTEADILFDTSTGTIQQVLIRGFRDDPLLPGDEDSWQQLSIDFSEFTFTGTGTYTFTALDPPWPAFSDVLDGEPEFGAGTGSVTVTEFSYVPDPSNGFATGTIKGTFQFTGCTTLGSEGCHPSGEFLAVTSGTFEICNFNYIEW